MARLQFAMPKSFEWSHVHDRWEHPDGSWIDVDDNGRIAAQGGNARQHLKLAGNKVVPAEDDAAVEQEIQAKGLTAPRVTPADIEAAIKSEEFVVRGTLTICILTLQNGFTVTGESACAAPENFDAELGKKIAKQKAMEKIWPLLGYALKEKLAQQEQQ